ncbi:MAG: molecular chaperone HtpG, partial [Ktedonobacteraceae bacterium]|nr:molecular chaperone HtpG [Ktedonobacteraceae bacterium]
DYLFGTEFLKFKDFSFQSVSKGEVDLSEMEDEQEKQEHKKSVDEAQDLVKRIKTALGDEVKDVRVTTRLTTSPACLVVDQYDIDPAFQRILKAVGQQGPQVKPILEINPHHPILLRMKGETDEKRLADWAFTLLDQSVLSLGEQLENPTRFVNRLNDLLSQL